MKILAIDTSSSACSIALLNGNEIKARHEIIPMQHAKCILSFIHDVLGSELHSLDALAWGCGPGSFTGLRIAASVIQALSYATKLPVINVSSLAALAQTAYNQYGWQHLYVAVDARMREVYWAGYKINNLGYAELINKEMLTASSGLVPIFSNSNWYGVGDAWKAYQAELAQLQSEGPAEYDVECLPTARAIAQLAKIKYENGELLHSFDALPVYLRDNVA
jgi:tRNA threonylcarbamoyladenosine biosynthesis protein TsaB